MTRRLIVRAEAEADIGDAALWYEHSEQGLGWAITSEVRSAINRIVENPFACVRLRKRPDVRRALVHRFPYNVFYIVREDAVVVSAVLYSARHDREWRRRL